MTKFMKDQIQQEADAGNLKAVLLLARSYESGKGVAQDKMKAMDLYCQVAEKVTIGLSFMDSVKNLSQNLLLPLNS